MGDHEGTKKFEKDDTSMKTKLNLTRFGRTFGKLRFNENSFFNTLLEFPAFWEYKPTNAVHADSPGVYTSDKRLNLSIKDKVQLSVMLFMVV